MQRLPKFNLKNKIAGISASFKRYPWTILFLIFTAFIIAWDIEGTNFETFKLITSGVVAALAFAAAQSAKENEFFTSKGWTLPVFLFAFLVAPVHYLILTGLADFSVELGIRSFILLLSLFVALLFLPIIKSEYKFEDNLLAAFKNFFQALLFSLVLFAGVGIVLAAINLLLFDVDYRVYMHLTNFVFVLFAPIFFLSLTPDFSKHAAEDLKLLEAKLSCPKVLEVLLSYIAIPLTWVFSIILVFYILLNIRSKFWLDNLLEPMLISYSAVVILLFLLSAKLDNPRAKTFIKRIPYVLLPIVTLQLGASAYHLSLGFLTYQRYFVLVYGTFAFIAALVFALQSLKRTSLIAALMLVFLLASIFPGIDVFRLSANSHVKGLNAILDSYGMLQDNSVVITEKVDEANQSRIIQAIRYLSHIDKLDGLTWLPEKFNVYSDQDYQELFGFGLYLPPAKGEDNYFHFNLGEDLSAAIGDYDYFGQMHAFTRQNVVETNDLKIEFEDALYHLYFDYTNKESALHLLSPDNQVSVFSLEEFFAKLREKSNTRELTLSEATYRAENQDYRIKLIFQSYDLYNKGPEEELYFSFYIFIGFK